MTLERNGFPVYRFAQRKYNAHSYWYEDSNGNRIACDESIIDELWFQWIMADSAFRNDDNDFDIFQVEEPIYLIKPMTPNKKNEIRGKLAPLLIAMIFFISCENPFPPEPMRYEKTAVVTFNDQSIDTITTVVYCFDEPFYYLFDTFVEVPLLFLVYNDSIHSTRIARDVESFYEIDL